MSNKRRARYHGRGQLCRLHRGALHAAQGNRCAYCLERFSALTPATVDHVVPKAADGHLGLGNTLLACEACNQAKGVRLPHPCERLLLWSVNLELHKRGWLYDVQAEPPVFHGPRNVEVAP